VQIRPATPLDAPAIAEIEVASWRAAYRDLIPIAFLESLSVQVKADIWAVDIKRYGLTDRKRVLVVESDGGILGFSLAGVPGGVSPGNGLLYFMYFHPDAWGQGYSRPLMVRVIDDFRDQGVRRAHLWVLRDNQRARRFYEGLGWVTDRETTTDRYGGELLESLHYWIDIQ
jgi:GNAT superfamily N-acetyltransferase